VSAPVAVWENDPISCHTAGTARHERSGGDVLSELTDQLEAIAQLCRRYGVARLAVFGSAATASFDPENSDIDLLVVFDPASDISRFEAHFGLKEDLESLLGHPVDLVAPAALANPYFARSVEQTRHDLFAA
jgi:uncharacterized protein